MLKNMKLKTSLFLGFGISILLSAAIIIVSLVMMSVQKDGYSRILDQVVSSNCYILPSERQYRGAQRA